jgi:muramoyltetrapeptide carboxypeptidase LdcA involved in peptidoglycan recycling
LLAVVFGDFNNPDDAELIQLVLQRFADDSENISCPVFRIQGIGHGSVNIPLRPFGTTAEINVSNEDLKLYTMCVNNAVVVASHE